MSRTAGHKHGTRDGFTLVEVLVALAAMASMLAAIASVAAANARGSRALDQRVALVQTARAVETGIPPRRDLRLGEIDGEIAGHVWRMTVTPLMLGGMPRDAQWVPRNVTIDIRSPSGARMTIETVRLVRSAAQ